MTTEPLKDGTGVVGTETVTCGATYADSRAEAGIRALREQQGYRVDGGCGKEMVWTWAYRCVECGRWMHRDCLLAHFTESGDDKKTAPVPAARERPPAQRTQTPRECQATARPCWMGADYVVTFRSASGLEWIEALCRGCLDPRAQMLAREGAVVVSAEEIARALAAEGVR